MADRVRLFVGINLDDSWTDGLAAVSDELRQTIGSGPRWVQPPLFHVTVVFLGDQSTKGVELAGQALRGAAAAASPFLLHLTEVHRLGGHEHGALVAGVADRSGGLRQLRVLLDQALRYHRVAFDAKPLVPHITLARPRRRSGPLTPPSYDLGEAPPLRVGTVTLFQSFLLPTGPKYQSLMKIGLGGR